MTGELQLALLGRADVRLDGEPVAGFYSSKAQALLYYLAVTGASHSRAALAGLLWADMPEADARTNLRQALTNLRRLVGPHLTITRQMVAFDRDSPHWLDVEAFRAGVAAASDRAGSSEDGTGMERLREAVDLYQGDFLAGFYVRDAPVFEEWMLAQEAQLRTSALGALHKLAAFYARRGDYENGVATTRRLLALEPWREGAHRQLMLLLARSGQRGAALAQYKACRQVLAEELGVEPAAETTNLYTRIWVARSEARHNLPPQPTPLVGREDELAQLGRHLADPDCHLLTMVGPGGMGKTRLALRAAEENAHLFLNGVTFVSLAPLASADSLAPAIADALQFPFSPSSDPETQLLEYLGNQERLLVLDNFEHLLAPAPPQSPPPGGEAPSVAPNGGTPLSVLPPSGGERGGASLLTQILAHAPDVKLLVTSRERLNLGGEWLFEVEGLAFPTTVDHPGRLEDYSAVQLFLGGAGRVRSGFSATEAEKPDVARICQLVAGMPLGIELAAAWARVLSPRDIRREIEQGLDFLTTSRRDAPARHRSITALFEHSWALLPEAERRAFAGLSVFRGGFRPEAARQVAGASLKALASLGDKSFLRLGGAGRYEMHELVRQYAAEKLQEIPGETTAIRERHCAYYCAFLQGREAHLRGGNQKEALTEIDAEVDNLRSSWGWAVEHERVRELGQAAGCLGIFYEIRGGWYEGESAFAAATDVLEAMKRRGINSGDQSLEDELDLALGLIVTFRGLFAYRLGLFEKSKDLSQHGLALLRQAGRRGQRYVALPLMILGNGARSQGDLAEAQQIYQETLVTAQEAGDRLAESMAISGLGLSALERGDFAQARQFLQQSLALEREAGDRWGMVFQLGALSGLAFMLGEYEEAEQLAQEGYTIAIEIDHREGMAFALQSLGRAACGLGKCGEARDYLNEALLIGVDIQARPTILDILPDLATVLLASDGSDVGREQAVELLAHCLNHPATWHDTKTKAEPMLAELEAHLPPEVFAQAQERGKAKGLDAVVAEVLAETA